MTKNPTRWVAESDPIYIHDDDLHCFYCKKYWGGDDNALDGDWHKDDCLWVWCVEWVKKRPTELERAGMQQFVDFISGHENLEIRIEDDEHPEDEPTEERLYPRQEWWFGD